MYFFMVKKNSSFQQTEEYFTLLFEQSPLATVEWTKDFIVKNWNKEAEKLFGISKKDALGKQASEFIAVPHTKEELNKSGKEFLKGKKSSKVTIPTHTKNKGIRICEWFSTPLIDNEGNIQGVTSIINDITEQERVHKEIEQLKKINDQILSAVGEGIYGVDLDGKVIFMNPSAAELLGFTIAELQGKVMHTLTHHSHTDGSKYPRQECPIYKAFKDGEVHRVNDELFFKKDGEAFPVEYTSTPMIENNKIVGAVVSFSDITERRRQENNILHLNTSLERSNKELQDFASVASHDLQEPLRKIQAFSDRLLTKYKAQLPEEAQDYMTRMNNAASRMQVLINDLLTFSRVTTKAQPFHKVDLSKIINEVLSDLEIAIESSQAQVSVEKLPHIYADPLQMRQLFQNLLSNSLKFHAKDKTPIITVTSQVVDDKSLSQNKSVIITVKDNGIGFNEKYADRIFHIFQRLHTTNEFTGSGVGLAVCRKIVERHGGAIQAQSTQGKGSTFIITLPFKPQNHFDDRPLMNNTHKIETNPIVSTIL